MERCAGRFPPNLCSANVVELDNWKIVWLFSSEITIYSTIPFFSLCCKTKRVMFPFLTPPICFIKKKKTLRNRKTWFLITLRKPHVPHEKTAISRYLLLHFWWNIATRKYLNTVTEFKSEFKKLFQSDSESSELCQSFPYSESVDSIFSMISPFSSSFRFLAQQQNAIKAMIKRTPPPAAPPINMISFLSFSCLYAMSSTHSTPSPANPLLHVHR